jgi:hypothetical protein
MTGEKVGTTSAPRRKPRRSSTESNPSVTNADRPRPKTAVVVIHGMGEQWPMNTLRGFVDAAWTFDPDLSEDWSRGETYSKPERVTGNFELRRITTRYWRREEAETENPRRVDFFEFYWAHLMRDNTFGSVASWIARLLLRRPSRVPARLLPGWIAGLAILALGVVLAVLTSVRPDLTHWGVPVWLWAVLAAGGAAFSALWLRPVAGDAARYLSPAPGNVAARQAIREAGIDLLNKLNATGEYDRIVVAGHSLGSVIGYDVLNYAWGRLDPGALLAAHPEGSETMALLGELESAAGKLEDQWSGEALVRYRDLQRQYFRSLAKGRDAVGRPIWLVSDFVTMGAPLSKADVLLARDAADLARRVGYRELPTNPPRSERATAVRFSYPLTARSRIPHHGAVFAPVVWSNVYYPNFAGLVGDFVSGRVAPLLGPGVRDIRVPIGFPWFRHLSYWSAPEKGGRAVTALRHALNLREHADAHVWGSQVASDPVRAERLAGGRKVEEGR